MVRSKNKKTKLIQLGFLSFVPQTVQFSNSFYENLSELYNLKDLLESEGIYINESESPILTDNSKNSKPKI